MLAAHPRSRCRGGGACGAGRASGVWSPMWCRAEPERWTDRGAARATCRSGCRSTWCPRRFVVLDAAAADPQRQGRPPGPARRRARRAARRAARRRARPPRSCWPGSGPSARRRAGRARRRLLRLGGHSLLATQLVSRLRDASASSCRCGPCSRRPTLAGSPRGIEASAAAARPAGAPPLLPRPRSAGAALPLSFAQQRLWFLDRLEPAGGLQHAARLPPRRAARRRRPSRAALARDRPPARGAAHGLRRRSDGEPVQVIAPAAAARCRSSTSAALPGRGAASAGARWPPRRRARPFDLARGPLAARRAAAPRRGGARAAPRHPPHRRRRLVGGRPGARARGALRRFAAGGRRRCRSCRSSTPTSPSGSAAGWPARCWRRSSPTGAAGSPALPPPRAADRPAAAGRAEPARRRAERLRSARRRWPTRWRRWRGGEGATLFMALLAAFQALLAPLHRAGRPARSARRSRTARRAEIEGLIGFFVNTLVLRADLAGDPRSRRCWPGAGGGARRLRPPGPAVRAPGRGAARRSATCAHAALPGDVRPAERAPRGASGSRAALARLGGDPGRPRSSTSSLRARAQAGGLDGRRWSTPPTSSTPRPSSACSAHFAALLAGTAADPETPALATCRCCRGRSAQQLLVEWNDTRREHPAGRDAPRAVRGAGAARRRTPWRVVAGGERLTYGELDRARRPAGPRAARARGGAGGARSASALERSPELVVGAARRAQGGRRLRAARSRLPARAPGASCWRTPAPAVLLDRAALLGACRLTGGRVVAAGRRGRPDDAAGERRRAVERGQPRLRDLHLGLDRAAQGGGRSPHRGLATPGALARTSPGWRPATACSQLPTSRFDVVGLRALRRRCSPAARWW